MPPDGCRLHILIRPQGAIFTPIPFQQIRAGALAGKRAIAVLGDTYTRSRPATSAATVEMLKDDSPSPPVPQVSSSGSLLAPASMGAAFPRMARSEPEQFLRCFPPSSAGPPGKRRSEPS